MNLTTPALLFPAISLLLLAYTNRFLTIAQLIRGLSAKEDELEEIQGQLENLSRRVEMIRLMQIYGVSSFLLCSLSMFALFVGWQVVGEILFGISLLVISGSLLYSLREVAISCRALDLELERRRKSRG